jgi:hypothetical protein
MCDLNGYDDGKCLPSSWSKTWSALVWFDPTDPLLRPCVFGYDAESMVLASSRRKNLWEIHDLRTIRFQVPSKIHFIFIVQFEVSATGDVWRTDLLTNSMPLSTRKAKFDKQTASHVAPRPVRPYHTHSTRHDATYYEGVLKRDPGGNCECC